MTDDVVVANETPPSKKFKLIFPTLQTYISTFPISNRLAPAIATMTLTGPLLSTTLSPQSAQTRKLQTKN